MAAIRRYLPSTLWLLGPVLLGLVILGLRDYTADYGRGWWSDAIAGLAEALVIAGVLGLTVDSLLKRRLIKEISTLSLQTIYGKDAPQRYTVALQEQLGQIQAISDTTWMVTLNWHVRGEVLRVRVHRDATIENISARHWSPTTPWLRASMPGQPACTFEDYRLRIERLPEGSRRTEPETRTYAPHLEEFQSRRPDGSLNLLLPRTEIERTIVPPGGRVDVLLVGTTFQPALGGLPLGAPTVRMGAEVKLFGEALPDLHVRAFTATGEVPMEDGDTPTFKSGFGFPGNGLRLEWNPKPVEGELH